MELNNAAHPVIKWDSGEVTSLHPEHNKFHKLQLENNEKLVGHAIDGNRNLRSLEDVAEFINYHGQFGDVSVTTKYSEPFIKTNGKTVTQCSDLEYLEELMKCLIPRQDLEEENKPDISLT